jgi:hypothetical protein
MVEGRRGFVALLATASASWQTGKLSSAEVHVYNKQRHQPPARPQHPTHDCARRNIHCPRNISAPSSTRAIDTDGIPIPPSGHPDSCPQLPARAGARIPDEQCAAAGGGRAGRGQEARWCLPWRVSQLRCPRDVTPAVRTLRGLRAKPKVHHTGTVLTVTSRLFGFLLGATTAGTGMYYYVIDEYRVSNELLTEDIYVRGPSFLTCLDPYTTRCG